MKLVHEISDFSEVNEFGVEYYRQRWIRDAVALAALNETLETNFQMVFREEDYFSRHQWKPYDIDWDAEHFFVVTASGKLLQFTNSEWGGVGIPVSMKAPR